MLKEGGRDFVPLPRERILHASPSRTTLSLTTPNSYPGKTPLSITSKGGIAYVTNQRVRDPREMMVLNAPSSY